MIFINKIVQVYRLQKQGIYIKVPLFQATLRKIVEACGSDILSAQDAQELVEPKLLDSFLAYSTQNESYV